VGFGQYSYHPKTSRPEFSSAIPAVKKRLRHVFDNPAHVWAHPRKKDGSGFEQDNARVAGGNWYFKASGDGTRVIYSYRDSYPIGSRFEHGKKTIFLLRAGKAWGVTTSGHMSGTRSAVPKGDKNVQVFTVPVMVNRYDHTRPRQEELEANLLFYVAEITDAIERHGKARSSYNIKG
jgi:hypothetical protein